METGIIGLPNVGKSSLFNALTNAGAAASNYPFTTIEPNVGVVPLPDRRLDRLFDVFKPPKKTAAPMRFVDIAGLVEGASEGKGRGNDFLDDIRGVDALIHVVQADLTEPDFEPFDPDLAGAVTRPFAPKPPKKPLPAGLAEPAAPAAAAPAEPAAEAPAPAPAPVEQAPLVFFMSPLTAEAPKGEPVVVTLFASGAQGLTEGTMTLRVDPRLKVSAITPGEFLTGAKGALEQAPGKDGLVTLTFHRAAGGGDSGVFATLQLEPVAAGKATVLIQDGQYKIGANPVPARYVNSLITIL